MQKKIPTESRTKAGYTTSHPLAGMSAVRLAVSTIFFRRCARRAPSARLREAADDRDGAGQITRVARNPAMSLAT